MILDQQLEAVNMAFSKQSEHFESDDFSNPILQWMRKRVRDHVLFFIRPGSHILELNAGTGLDSVFFATRGHTLLATDIANGMIKKLKEKANSPEGRNMIEVRKLSYTELDELPENQFDYIFSNFGGMNCVPDLKPVIDQFKRLLKPNGIISLVVMPKICPWELCSVFKGNTKLAFRRFQRNGAQTNIDGISFLTYYFNPQKLIKDFGDNYRLLKLEGLCILAPPPGFDKMADKYQKTVKFLIKLEEFVARFPILSRFADHYILSMQYLPEDNV